MDIIIQCPHCDDFIEISHVNCGIFRHAVYKNGQQMHPHASKQLCDYAKANDQIYGCGKPFKVVDDKAVSCEYI